MPRVRVAFVALLCVAMLAACGGGAGTPGSSASPSPSGRRLPIPELKLLVVKAIGGMRYLCGPPVVRIPTHEELVTEIKDLSRSRPADVAAILHHLHLVGTDLSDDDRERILSAANTITWSFSGRDGAAYRFDLTVRPLSSPGPVTWASGTVDPSGTVRVDFVKRNLFVPCPVCLAANTRIATPGGFVRVQDVRVGMTVWSTDRDGRRMRATVTGVGSTPVPLTHEMVRLVLADGRSVLVSPGHPTPDGSPVGELRSGSAFDGSTVVSTRRVPYSGGFTFDLLPSGPTGTYFANGVLLGSTLSGTGPRRPGPPRRGAGRP